VGLGAPTRLFCSLHCLCIGKREHADPKTLNPKP